MKCIVCQQGRLEVINSRKHPSEPKVWRRRKCSNCSIVFTTKETPDYDHSFKVVYGRKKIAFDKAVLLAALCAAGGHMQKQSALPWLADVIASKSFKASATNNFTLATNEYREIIKSTLDAYDTLLAANYEARNFKA